MAGIYKNLTASVLRNSNDNIMGQYYDGQNY